MADHDPPAASTRTSRRIDLVMIHTFASLIMSDLCRQDRQELRVHRDGSASYVLHVGDDHELRDQVRAFQHVAIAHRIAWIGVAKSCCCKQFCCCDDVIGAVPHVQTLICLPTLPPRSSSSHRNAASRAGCGFTTERPIASRTSTCLTGVATSPVRSVGQAVSATHPHRGA